MKLKFTDRYRANDAIFSTGRNLGFSQLNGIVAALTLTCGFLTGSVFMPLCT